MLFLKKDSKSTILEENLKYEKDSKRIKELLMLEQMNFCAYSERYLLPLDAVEVEHFNPNDKNTPFDSYYNWYATLRWMNNHKYKKLDARFLPILSPYDDSLVNRLNYRDGIFIPVDNTDTEVINLIEFLGLNKREVYEERQNHISRIKYLQSILSTEENSFKVFLANYKENLSFGTALKHELGINIFEFIV